MSLIFKKKHELHNYFFREVKFLYDSFLKITGFYQNLFYQNLSLKSLNDLKIACN